MFCSVYIHFTVFDVLGTRTGTGTQIETGKGTQTGMRTGTQTGTWTDRD
jgi:hypothetical protein